MKEREKRSYNVIRLTRLAMPKVHFRSTKQIIRDTYKGLHKLEEVVPFALNLVSLFVPIYHWQSCFS